MSKQLEAEWITDEPWPDDMPEDRYAGWLGGISPAPSRDEYLRTLGPDEREVFLAIERGVKRQGLIGMTGDTQDTSGGFWRLSDGRVASFSWRGWGDIMQAIVDKREGYIRYYM